MELDLSADSNRLLLQGLLIGVDRLLVLTLLLFERSFCLLLAGYTCSLAVGLCQGVEPQAFTRPELCPLEST